MHNSVTDEADSGRGPYLVGVVLLFAAGVLWSLNGALIKLVFEDGRGPHAVTIAFYRSLFAGLFLLPLARGKLHTLANVKRSKRQNVNMSKRRNVKIKGKTESLKNSTVNSPVLPFRLLDFLTFLRPAAVCCVVFFTLMTICFVLAVTKTEAANAIILQYTSTFWIFALSPLILGEKPHLRDLWLLGIAMIGIGIIFAGKADTDLAGLLIALCAGLCFGLETMMIRLMRNSDSAAVIVLNCLGSAVLLLPAALFVGHLMVTPKAWALLVLLGIVQFGIPYYLYARALVHVPAYVAALITLTEPILVPVWTYLAVKEKVPATTIIGGGVILLALILFVRTARHRIVE